MDRWRGPIIEIVPGPRTPIAPARFDLAVRGLAAEVTVFSRADLERHQLGLAPQIMALLRGYFQHCAGVPLRLIPWDGSDIRDTHWPLTDDVARVFAA